MTSAPLPEVHAKGSHAIRVFIVLVFVQFILHLFTAFSSHDPRLLAPHLVAWLHDTLVLSALFGLSWLCLRLLPSRVRSVGESVTVAILILSGVLLSLYPQMLREYLSFPVNLFASNADSAGILIRDYLGFDRLAPALLSATAAIASLFVPPLPPKRTWASRLAIAVWALLLVAGTALAAAGRQQPERGACNPRLEHASRRAEASARAASPNRRVPPDAGGVEAFHRR